MRRTRAEEARDLSRKLFAVGQRVKADFDGIAADHELTPLQARTVLELGRPCPMRALAEEMSCDASNITGLADRLERLGLVERVPDTADRRVKLLALTPAGSDLREKLVRRVGEGSTVTARLDRAERDQLEALLDRLLSD